jgi:hypothetical protein
LLSPLKLLGVRIIDVLHNVVRPNEYKPTQRSRLMILQTDGWFWRHVADAVVSVSREYETQGRELAGTIEVEAAQIRAPYDKRPFSISRRRRMNKGPLRSRS